MVVDCREVVTRKLVRNLRGREGVGVIQKSAENREWGPLFAIETESVVYNDIPIALSRCAAPCCAHGVCARSRAGVGVKLPGDAVCEVCARSRLMVRGVRGVA